MSTYLFICFQSRAASRVRMAGNVWAATRASVHEASTAISASIEQVRANHLHC